MLLQPIASSYGLTDAVKMVLKTAALNQVVSKYSKLTTKKDYSTVPISFRVRH